ncbi:MAG: hypothetical protein J3K34DRAFT_207850 [Monoraphidium minutum]|nr:MAG: hypothetical protein J3K34DRAFT_207850 [Monoraphidium minutum]
MMRGERIYAINAYWRPGRQAASARTPRSPAGRDASEIPAGRNAPAGASAAALLRAAAACCVVLMVQGCATDTECSAEQYCSSGKCTDIIEVFVKAGGGGTFFYNTGFKVFPSLTVSAAFSRCKGGSGPPCKFSWWFDGCVGGAAPNAVPQALSGSTNSISVTPRIGTGPIDVSQASFPLTCVVRVNVSTAANNAPGDVYKLGWATFQLRLPDVWPCSSDSMCLASQFCFLGNCDDIIKLPPAITLGAGGNLILDGAGAGVLALDAGTTNCAGDCRAFQWALLSCTNAPEAGPYPKPLLTGRNVQPVTTEHLYKGDSGHCQDIPKRTRP